MLQILHPLLIAFLILISLPSCQQNKAKEMPEVFSGWKMTIPYRILLSPLSEELRLKALTVVEETFQEVDAHYNRYNPQSELSQLNHLKKGEKRKLSPGLYHLLQKSDEMVHLTKGLFDPTVEPLAAFYRDCFERGIFPSADQIATYKEFIGWQKISFKGGIFEKEHDLTQLDLGGIAKGYAVDLLLERFNQLGIGDVLVDWGGEIRASGQHSTKRPWQVGISNLGDQSSQVTSLISLRDQALATSGNYLQFWRIALEGGGEKTFTHIVHPQTLMPLEVTPYSIASVTVLAKSCTDADALATAGMLFSSIEKAQEWAQSIEDASFWFIAKEIERK